MSSRLLDFFTQIMVMTIIISVVLLVIGIGVLVLIHVCIVGRVFRRSFNSTERGERWNDRNRGLSLEDLQRLPCYNFKASEKGSSPIDCAVCLDSFQMGDKCRLLPSCKHSFHAHCVDSWLLKTPICPICRTSAVHAKSGKVLMDQQSIFTGGVGFELRESPPAAVVGFPVSANPSPLHGENLSPLHASTSG